MKPLRIGLLSPWYGGSHKRWADGLKTASSHQIEIFGVSARHWKWRMHGAAVSLARMVLESDRPHDLFLADDMMDVAVFTAMVRQAGIQVPVCTYFHENQLGYPFSPRDTDLPNDRDQHYAWVNFTSALVSDRVYFNSHYHMRSFLSLLGEFLAGLPDGDQAALVPVIERKSAVLPLGMDLQSLSVHREDAAGKRQLPLILWNHRWEFDKGINEFLKLLLDLDSAGIAFEVALLGERGKKPPALLAAVVDRLGERILVNGMARDIPEYARWLWRADIAPVTAVQDFFGGSVVEAIHCGCHLLVPDRLAYPEHVSDRRCLYHGYTGLLDSITRLITSGEWKKNPGPNPKIEAYDWRRMGSVYDSVISECAGAPDSF